MQSSMKYFTHKARGKRFGFFQKTLASLMILMILITPVAAIPQQAQAILGAGDDVHDVANTFVGAFTGAQQASNTATNWKQWIVQLLGMVLKQIASVLLKKMTEATVNWINGGFKGSPQFVSNPKSFFKGIGDTQLQNLIDTIGYNASKYPYGRQISMALISSYRNKNADISKTFKYTLTDILGQEATKFQNNFHVGGWAAYDSYVSNPANNAVGSLFLANDKALTAINSAQQKVQKEIDLGQGFLNQRTCTKYRDGPQSDQSADQALATQNANTAAAIAQLEADVQEDQKNLSSSTPGSADYKMYENQLALDKQQLNSLKTQKAQQGEHNFLLGGAKSDANCLEWKSLSPGSIVQSTMNRALGSKFSQTELGAALGNSISAIVNALMNQLLSKGLSALGTLMSGDTSSNTQTWSYEGQTLSGSASDANGSGDSSWAGTPDRVLDFNKLFYVGTADTDQDGNVVTSTVIELTQHQVDTYKKIVDILRGTATQDGFSTVLKKLDLLTPGPKLGWDSRLKQRVDKAVQKWNQRADSRVIKKRKQEASDIAEYIDDKSNMIQADMRIQALTQSIPSYTDVQAIIVDGLKYSTQMKDYLDKYVEAMGILARLKSIKSRLDTIKDTQAEACPEPEQDQGLDSFLGQHGNQPITCNPFDHLTPSGQAALKSVLKAYSLVEKDIPNGVINQQGDAILQQVTAQYSEIVDKMMPKVAQEVQAAIPHSIYKIHLDKRIIKSITGPIDPAQLPSQCPMSVMLSKGYCNPSAQSQAALQGVNAALNALMLIGTFGLSAPITAGTTAAGAIAIQNQEHDEYISSMGTASLGDTEIDSATSLAELQLITDKPRQDMLDELQSDFGSDDLDDDYGDMLANITDPKLILVYSLVKSSGSLDFGDKWDSAATGIDRLKNALDTIDDFEIDVSDPPKKSGEKMYYCQVILDKYDTRKWRAAYASLFRTKAVNLNCNDIYESSDRDYNSSY